MRRLATARQAVAGDCAEGLHGDLHPGSLFQPIVDLRAERVVEPPAPALTVRRADGTPLPADAPVCCLRQRGGGGPCRPAGPHAACPQLLAQRQHAGGYLQVAVHPRHLQAVSNQHGLVYARPSSSAAGWARPISCSISMPATRPEQPRGAGAGQLPAARLPAGLARAGQALALPGVLALQPDILRIASADPCGVRCHPMQRERWSPISPESTTERPSAALSSQATLFDARLFGELASACRPTHTATRNPTIPIFVWSPPMKIANNVTELVGNTPLVKLNRVTAGAGATVVTKLEFFNPGHSVKDRIAVAMRRRHRRRQDRPEYRGPGADLGNTGIGLAMVCAARGIKAAFVMPETMSRERKAVAQGLRARLILTPGPEGMGGAIAKARNWPKTTRKYFIPQQFENPANPEIHRQTTAEEIWRDTDGR